MRAGSGSKDFIGRCVATGLAASFNFRYLSNSGTIGTGLSHDRDVAVSVSDAGSSAR